MNWNFNVNFRAKPSYSNTNKLQGVGDSVLQAILNDDSDKLLDLISDHLSDTKIFYLPSISKRLPDFLSSNPSLLSISSFFASTNCFRLLFSLDSKADAKDQNGRISIHFAAAGGSLEILRELDQHFQISENADESTRVTNDIYNYRDSSNQTPMHYAAQFGRLNIIKYLYLKGAELDLHRDNENRRPIHLACLYGHVEVVRFFVENGVPLIDKDSMHPIHYACIGGDVATIEYLISQKVDLNVMYCSNPPIFYAAKFGSLSAIKVLLKHKVAFKNRGRKSSPIHEAALNGHLDVVHFFIEQGCDPNIYDSTGRSILHAAIEGNHYDIAKYLLSLGATVFPNGKYEKIKESQTDTEEEIYISKPQVRHTKKDPIITYTSMDDKMLLLLLDHINIDKYINDYSSYGPDYDILEERKTRIIDTYVKYQSLALLDILIELKLHREDWTYIYCQVIDAKLDNLAILMLDKKLPFYSCSELATKLIEFNNKSVLNKFFDSGLKLTKENNPKVFKEVILLFIQRQNGNLLDILIERKIIAGDCTDIYYQLLDHRYKPFNLAKLLLSKGVQFQSTTNLISKIASYNDVSLLQRFIDSGLQFSPNSIQTITTEAISQRRINIIRFLLDSKILLPEFQPIPIQNSSFPFISSFQPIHFINVILHTVVSSFPYGYFSFGMNSSHNQAINTDRVQLIEICTLFLKHGFTFSSDDNPISIHQQTNLSYEKCELLFYLLNLIEESYPGSVDFSKYTISHIEGLLYYFHTKLSQKLLNFLVSHNFSFKSGNEKYNDYPLILTALLGRRNLFSKNSVWANKPAYLNGLNEPTDDEIAYQKGEHTMNHQYSYCSNFSDRDPDLKLINYLFDHDYTISSKSLNAIVKVSRQTKNHELIHQAFKHCDLSNRQLSIFSQVADQKTALEIACKNGFVDIAKELIERGANINEGGYGNCTSPLYYATMAKNEELINLLKSKGAITAVGNHKMIGSRYFGISPNIESEFRLRYGRKCNQINFNLVDFY